MNTLQATSVAVLVIGISLHANDKTHLKMIQEHIPMVSRMYVKSVLICLVSSSILCVFRSVVVCFGIRLLPMRTIR